MVLAMLEHIPGPLVDHSPALLLLFLSASADQLDLESSSSEVKADIEPSFVRAPMSTMVAYASAALVCLYTLKLLWSMVHYAIGLCVDGTLTAFREKAGLHPHSH